MAIDDIITTAELYNSYMEEVNMLLKEIKNCELQLMKDLFKFKTTERDEIKIALFETKRKALLCVKYEDDELKLDIQSTLPNDKMNDDSKNTVEVDENEIEVVDPIKLVHGGFTSLSIKNTQREYMNLILHIIKIVNLKKQIEQRLSLV